MGPMAEEGRGKTTKCLGAGCLASLTGDARMGKPILGYTRILYLYREVSEKTETSKYLEENTSIEIPLVVANERGIA